MTANETPPQDGAQTMTEDQYQTELELLCRDWGSVYVDGGYIRAANDPTRGLLVGMRAKLIAEIINRAMKDRT